MTGPVGRASELEDAMASLDALASGPQTIAITGPAGIGKTTLWGAILADARARGVRTTETRAVGAGAQLAFGGLVDLLDPLVDEVLDDLPPVQRAALEVALYRIPARRRSLPELATSLGALAAFRAIASHGPLLVAIDDLQWLDGPTSRIVEYVARRLGDARLGLLLAVRSDHPSDPLPAVATAPQTPVRRIHLGPLGMDAMDALLRDVPGVRLRRPALARIHAASRGNPFHALEIARSLARIGAAADQEGLAMSAATDDLVVARLRALSDAARWPLAAVAALARPSMEQLEAACPGSGQALGEARSAGVLELEGDWVRFTHPLLAAAAYGLLGPSERRDLHARLARAVDDPEARAWHLALSIDRTSEAVAMELETAARGARSRGAADTSAEMLLRAASLTPPDDPDGRLRRTVVAGEDLIRAGDPTRARAVLEPAVEAAARGPARADALLVLADTRSSDDWVAKARLLEHALHDADGAHALRSRILHDLAQAKRHTMRDAPGQLALARQAVVEAEVADEPVTRCSAYLCAILAEADAGLPLDVGLLDRAMSLAPHMEHLRVLFWPALVKAYADLDADRVEEAETALRALRARAIELGDWDSLPLLTTDLAQVAFRRGDWALARRLATEAEGGSRQNGQAHGLARALGVRALVALASGDEAAGLPAVEEGLELARVIASRSVERDHHMALGLLALSVGDAGRAEGELRPAAGALLEEGYLGATRPVLWWAEALALIGRVGEARHLVERAEEVATRVGQASALALGARVRGILATVLGDEQVASAAFEGALAFHEHGADAFERARTLLAQGESLRRFRRRGRARASLAEASAAFLELGAPRWHERAAAGLGRTGHRDAGSRLTTAEEQVARLAAVGRTNREVADVLFMSPHTVEAHLTRIYRSLGIRGRTELARALGAAAAWQGPTPQGPTDRGSG